MRRRRAGGSPPRFVPALLALCLLGPAATALGQQGVAVLGDGRFEVLPAEGVGSGERGVEGRLWVWDEGVPPRRLDGWTPDTPLALAARRIAVHLPAGPRRGWELVAAPVAMWLEVPESLLPRWPVPERGDASLPAGAEAWRLRLLAPQRGTWWIDVAADQARVTPTLFPAADHRIHVVDDAGTAVDHAAVTWLVGPPGTSRHGVVAVEQVVAGRLAVRGLPDVEEVSLLAGAQGFQPASWRSLPSALPERLRFAPGSTLSGRFVDPRDLPVDGVEVVAEGWVGGAAEALVRRSATSDPEGRWSVAALPPGRLALDARKPGFVDLVRRLEAAPGVTDLGRLVVRPGADVPVRVVDDEGNPVAGATLRFGARRAVVTAPDGRAVLSDQPAGESVPVGVEAEGHLGLRGEVAVGDGEQVLALRRAFRLAGRVVGPDATPPSDAAVVIEAGSRSRREELAGDGTLDLAVEPGVELTLRLSSPRTEEVRIAVAPGLPGEVRDLGEVVLGRGHAVIGRLWSEVDGLPLAGARVWSPRPGGDGSLAWMRSDLLATTTDAEGQFALRGLPARSHLLRFDAPRHARRHVEVAVGDEGELESDLGDVVMRQGGEIVVELRQEAEGAVARADLRGEWLELDMLQAPVGDGTARLTGVPEEAVLLTVVANRTVICEDTVRVADEETVVVDCENRGSDVAGYVLVGDEPAGEGYLSWRRAGEVQPPAVIVNRDSPRGARRQEVFGAGRPALDVAVDPSGYFRAENLAAGPWEVTWMPLDGVSSPPLGVEVPAADVADLELRFRGDHLAGVTVDEDGEPVSGARVSVLGTGASALSGADGRFRVVGLEPGRHRLFARLGDLRSEELEVAVGGGVDEPAVLVLAPRQGERLHVVVRDAADAPAAGALVVLGFEDGRFRILTADAAGRAAVAFDPPRPARLRLAAVGGDRWAFTGWQAVAEGGEIDLVIGDAGDLTVYTDEEISEARIVSARAGEIGPFLASVGVPLRLRRGSPLRLRGLPAGTYTVTVGGASRVVEVRAGDSAEVELP